MGRYNNSDDSANKTKDANPGANCHASDLEPRRRTRRIAFGSRSLQLRFRPCDVGTDHRLHQFLRPRLAQRPMVAGPVLLPRRSSGLGRLWVAHTRRAELEDGRYLNRGGLLSNSTSRA